MKEKLSLMNREGCLTVKSNQEIEGVSIEKAKGFPDGFSMFSSCFKYKNFRYRGFIIMSRLSICSGLGLGHSHIWRRRGEALRASLVLFLPNEILEPV